jgi:hypothetical protein
LVRRWWIAAAFLFGLVFPTGGMGGQAEKAAVSLTGQISDEDGAPLSGVEVQVFVGGLLAARGRSGEDGGYEVGFSFEQSNDPTVVVWWVPKSEDQVVEMAVVRESARARALGLWSPCLPRLGEAHDLHHDLTLRRRTDYDRFLKESDCLGNRR